MSSARKTRGRATPRVTIGALIILVLLGAGQRLFAQHLEPATPPASGTLAQDTTVHFLDVGQGDSALILSGGEAVLIDAGTRKSADTVVEYLHGQGVTQLKAVIATHPHEDHIGGMAAVLDAFPVEVFFTPDHIATTQTYSRMLDALEENGAKVVVPEPGSGFTLESGADFRFLSPASDADWGDNTNNYSLVAMVTLGDSRVLFTGDAESDVEARLVAENADLRCNVLKVGHHGSQSSSSPAFLTRTGAKIAVISCGKDNDYGHPHTQTLENLRRAGITDVRRTDKLGPIVLDFAMAEQAEDTQKEDAS